MQLTKCKLECEIISLTVSFQFWQFFYKPGWSIRTKEAKSENKSEIFLWDKNTFGTNKTFFLGFLSFFYLSFFIYLFLSSRPLISLSLSVLFNIISSSLSFSLSLSLFCCFSAYDISSSLSTLSLDIIFSFTLSPMYTFSFFSLPSFALYHPLLLSLIPLSLFHSLFLSLPLSLPLSFPLSLYVILISSLTLSLLFLSLSLSHSLSLSLHFSHVSNANIRLTNRISNQRKSQVLSKWRFEFQIEA